MRAVVIGASAAGGSLCETLRALDPCAEITLITEEPLPLYSRCLLPLYLNGERMRKELQFRPSAWPKDLQLEVIHGRAVGISLQERKVELSTGEAVDYDRLGVATGASPCQPAIPGIRVRGVFSLYTLASAKAIKRWLPRTHEVAVLGAGLIGVKAAVALSTLGKKVTVIEQRATLLPDTIDGRAARIVAQLLAGHGVRVLTQETLTEVVSHPDHTIKSLCLTSGEMLACDMLLLAVGTRPNSDLLQTAGAAVNRGVLVDEHMQTSLPGVYAAGDVAEAPRLGSGERLGQANWLNSKLEGRLAAYNMLEHWISYPGRLRVNAVRFFELPLISTGQTSTETGDEEILEEPSAQVYRKLVFEDGCLKGMILLGDAPEAGTLTTLIRQARDVGSIRDRLLGEGAGCLPEVSVGLMQKRHHDAQLALSGQQQFLVQAQYDQLQSPDSSREGGKKAHALGSQTRSREDRSRHSNLLRDEGGRK